MLRLPPEISVQQINLDLDEQECHITRWGLRMYWQGDTKKNKWKQKRKKKHKRTQNEDTKIPRRKNWNAYLKKNRRRKKNRNQRCKFKLSIVEYCMLLYKEMQIVLCCVLIQYTYNISISNYLCFTSFWK